jgi:hypothetical protein
MQSALSPKVLHKLTAGNNFKSSYKYSNELKNFCFDSIEKPSRGFFPNTPLYGLYAIPPKTSCVFQWVFTNGHLIVTLASYPVNGFDCSLLVSTHRQYIGVLSI